MDNYATHQRLLLRACLRTSGPMLELGAGWYSTPIMHEVAGAEGRKLLTHDNDPEWLEAMRKPFGRSWHGFEMLNRESWKLSRLDRWGVVFIDHGPRPEEPRNSKGLLNALDRAQAVLDLMDKTDVFVLHDTEEPVRWEYDWDKVFPLFHYKFTDTEHAVQTTLLSNRIDVSQWDK